jgi:hypothetical protein
MSRDRNKLNGIQSAAWKFVCLSVQQCARFIKPLYQGLDTYTYKIVLHKETEVKSSIYEHTCFMCYLRTMNPLRVILTGVKGEICKLD